MELRQPRGSQRGFAILSGDHRAGAARSAGSPGYWPIGGTREAVGAGNSFAAGARVADHRAPVARRRRAGAFGRPNAGPAADSARSGRVRPLRSAAYRRGHVNSNRREFLAVAAASAVAGYAGLKGAKPRPRVPSSSAVAIV